MSEPLERVFVGCSRGTIELPGRSRDALLAEIGRRESADSVRDAFATVAPSGTVRFSRADVTLLVDAINRWARSVGAPRLPPGIWGLRNALVDDLRDTAD